MHTEILGITCTFLLALLLAIPLGHHIAFVYSGVARPSDRLFKPLEKLIYKLSGVDPLRPMTWQQHLAALLTINLCWFLLSMFLLMNQAWLPLNPDHNPSQSADLAFNTAISFVVNCNLQHYSGETGVSYLSQLWLMFLQFVSAASGMAAAAVVFIALKQKTGKQLGNFYFLFVRTCTRILLPLAIFVAVLLLMHGVPMTFAGKARMPGLEVDSLQIARGPAAAFVAIKHIGTNGGGFFGANSAHPLENPDYFTNMVALIAQIVLPLAMVFALGYFLQKKRFAYMILGLMTFGFLVLLLPTLLSETQGNPAIARMGINMQAGAMEGKEIRFGALASGFWSIATTVISTGSVNAMHDSFMPVSGMNQLLAMMTNAFYGGVGAGILNIFIFIILAVFISGLMVGRTPEFMGKKIEAREMKIAMIVALLHPLLILAGTAITVALPRYGAATLNNSGFHGFSEMLYEFTSAAANNGSGFEGLGDNTPWWNISTGIVLLLSRFIPIAGPVAIAGLLAGKKYTPPGDGSLPTDTPTFGIMIFAVIVIITALSFFPALALGPIAESLSL